ncbi:MAG: hemerythrin domain-containing protein [Elusimicrobia bacterium]|nr:hemerythrin domain-containing protein [Elusimicrobiota bacterium]
MLDLLREDHRRLKELFAEFESGNAQTRREVSREILSLVHTHNKVKMKLLYPRAAGISRDAEELVLRGKEARHIANLLLLELKVMPVGPRYFAKVATLIDGLRAHMQEEEAELFPLVERSDMDLVELGERMTAMKDAARYGGFLTRDGNGLRTLIGAGAIVGLGLLIRGVLSRGRR